VQTNAVGNDYAAESYFTVWGKRLIYSAVGKFLSHLSDNVEPRPHILDVGCGPGTYTDIFRSLGLQVTAIDHSDEMLAIARRHVKDPHALLKMDATNLEFPDQSFDAIWCSAFLVHVPRRQAPVVLSNLRRVLKDDGLMYLSAQIAKDCYKGCRVQPEGRAFFYYSPEELQALFRQTGFEVIDCWSGSSRTHSLSGTHEKIWRQYLLKKNLPRVSIASTPVGAEAQLSHLGERRLLEKIRQIIPSPQKDYIVLGIGDDCAALRLPSEELVVVTIDPCPTPVISLLGDEDPWYHGWFSMIINLSDLGAMGAKPLGILLSVEAPETMSVADFERFYAGILDTAMAYDCPVIGGNLKDSPRFNCIGTALGTVSPDRMLRRDAARPGERVVVLGEMGCFWAGVIHRLKRIQLPQADRERLLQNLKRPKPRVREGRRLSEFGLSRCAMDSSDGLTTCFYEIARSGKDIDLHLDLAKVQPDPGVLNVANAFDIDVRKLLFAWGDWQLVTTVEEKHFDQLRAVMAELGCPVTDVGWITSGKGNVWVHDHQETRRLTYLASERFTRQSYFSYGLESYLRTLINTPFTSPT
jgi:thiamine-monophosphate kinase